MFKRAWLNVGRDDLLPRNGSYFTKELTFAKTSIVVVRDMDGQVRAFHNICRHRGNKLVWNDYPREETSGSCRQFTCKYHGWRYDLDGSCAFVQQESEFFDLDKADYGLVPVNCDVWEGFIFINLDKEPRQTLREFLGPMVLALEGYPFERCSERWFYRAPIQSNWKLFSDNTAEFYHAPVLHAPQMPAAFAVPAREAGFEAPYYQLEGPHRLVTTGGIRPWEMPAGMFKPTEEAVRAGLWGPWDASDIAAEEMPVGLNPGKMERWGNQSFQLWPNLVFLFWSQGFYFVYNYWPTAHDGHGVRGDAVPAAGQDAEGADRPRDDRRWRSRSTGCRTSTRARRRSRCSSRGSSTSSRTTTRSSCRATCTSCVSTRSRSTSARRDCDPMTTAKLPAQFSDLERFSEWILPTEHERYTKRIDTPFDDLQEFYDAAFPRLEEALTYCDQYQLGDLPDDVRNLMHLLQSLVTVSFSVEAWGQGRVPDTGSSEILCLVEPAL